jgi:hypothetical protein
LNSSEVRPGIIESYRKQARAAIEAMRDPTEEMCSVGEAAGFLHWSLEEGEGLDEVDMAVAWQAMIDAALGNGKMSEPSNVVNMKLQSRLIREAREAREAKTRCASDSSIAAY